MHRVQQTSGRVVTACYIAHLAYFKFSKQVEIMPLLWRLTGSLQ